MQKVSLHTPLNVDPIVVTLLAHANAELCVVFKDGNKLAQNKQNVP